MDTLVDARAERRRRRRHSPQFKSEVVASCRQAGVSIAAVALANGLNANLLRRWIVTAEQRSAPDTTAEAEVPAAVAADTVSEPTGFVAIPFEKIPTESTDTQRLDIRVELRRAGTTVKVDWPVSQAAACATWLRDLLR